MIPVETLRQRLMSIDGEDYAAYQSLLGRYSYPHFTLSIEQIPKDPYAPPHTGIYRAHIPFEYTCFPEKIRTSRVRGIAYRDYLARRFFSTCGKIAGGNRGTGNSGIITIDEPGQWILDRSSVVLKEKSIEIRLFLGLPASGRKIRAGDAGEMIFHELPEIVEEALSKENIDGDEMEHHIHTSEDASFLRKKLAEKRLVAFIANKAILPRESGTSDRPLKGKSVVLFGSPESLVLEIELPYAGRVAGMGIPAGITLIVGGGYHGKSTLLQTIERGIHNHIPGDGRELCVSDERTVKVRSYSGRYVQNVDISPFINNLPAKKETRSFSTENASGSTSQAASIQEAAEVGASLLLMDEDTCATNFMIRDEKMQKLVKRDDEPITTYIDRAEQLFNKMGISTILVLGGTGDYFDISHKIIQMKNYLPLDVTEKAHRISSESPVKRKREDEGSPVRPSERRIVPGSIDPCNKHRKVSVYAKEVDRINFGKTVIDLADVEQLLELSQTKAIMHALMMLNAHSNREGTLKEILESLIARIENEGLDILSEKVSGHFAEFRIFELAAAINRLRGARMEQGGS